MSAMRGPLLTRPVGEALRAAREAGEARLLASFDLGRSESEALLEPRHWRWQGQDYGYPGPCRDRTIYHWDGEAFVPVSRYQGALIKLVPTDWGAPTFEIDGIKMLPTAQVSPFEDAVRKVALVQPAGRCVLDTCGGLGYFAAAALAAGVSEILSVEKNPDVRWLRRLNPWSPIDEGAGADARLQLIAGDVTEVLPTLPEASFDALLHDPPRFGIAGELYSQAFYAELARVLRPRGRLFHYTGRPNRLTSGRDLPKEVAGRLQRAGFSTEMVGDGVLAVRGGGGAGRRR
jgi:predicted methyltransferase